jgi:hypothetical protein
MSISVDLPETTDIFAPGAVQRNDATWKPWVAKGRARERRNTATRVQAVKATAIAVLLATAAFWTELAQCAVAIRFIVVVSAVVVMLQHYHANRYATAALFGVLALVYNPVAPVFVFAGDWQRIFVAASSLSFIASMLWREPSSQFQKATHV